MALTQAQIDAANQGSINAANAANAKAGIVPAAATTSSTFINPGTTSVSAPSAEVYNPSTGTWGSFSSTMSSSSGGGGSGGGGSTSSSAPNYINSPINPVTGFSSANPAGAGGAPIPVPGANTSSTGAADPNYSIAQQNIAPTTPQTPEDYYAIVQAQLQPLLDKISQEGMAAETAANLKATQATSDLNAGANSRGLAGSSEATSEAGQITMQRGADVAAALQTQATALQSVAQFAIPEAYTMYTDALTRSDANSKAYIAQAQVNLNTSLAGLAGAGISLDALQASNPAQYNQLLQYANGDPNMLSELYIQAATKNSSLLNGGQPLSTNGNTLVYGIQTIDPKTGKPSLTTQSVTLPFNIQGTYGWTMTKTGTNTSVLSDPQNGANYIAYTTDPLSGQVTVSGSGTGLADLQASGITPGVPGNGNTNSSSTSTSSTTSIGTNYPTTFSAASGITDLTTPMNTDTVGQVGLGAIVNGIITAEGGSAPGVTGNPGNILYMGLPGQTDSGVHPTDNPNATFANYDPSNNNAAGIHAIGTIVDSAASGTNSNYGTAPTFQSFLEKYANLGGTNTPAQSTGSNGTSSAEYGALSNVAGFNPGTPGKTQTNAQIIDQGAFNYLQSYLSGNTPSSSGGMGGLPAKVYSSAVQARAEQLYTQATGKPLPNAAELANNLSLINGNNAMLVSLGNNIPTISANAKLLENKITAANINQQAPAINAVIDPIINAMGNPAVASYMAQTSTLTNELGSLLALKNAGGAGNSTVHDKLAAAGLIDKNSSAAQIAAVVNTILQEAGNAQDAIGNTNFKLYTQTDPLGIDPQNPLNSNMTFTDENGNPFTASKGSLTADEVNTLIGNGYNIQYSTQ